LRRLVDDRFVLNTNRGATSGKEELIQSILAMHMVGQSIRERSVLIEGDIAIVFGTAELRFAVPGKAESTSTLRYTATYVKRQGHWRMLALQMQPRAPA
jgi:ketosteroid isomerase-like protein